MKVGGQYYFYQNDHLGTPQKLTAVNGAVVWSAKYSSFGEADVDTSFTVTNNLRFPGQYYDKETELHYNYFRYYLPSLGRYSKNDPIGFSGGINFYLYLNNNSINSIDPYGLRPLFYRRPPNPNPFPPSMRTNPYHFPGDNQGPAARRAPGGSSSGCYNMLEKFCDKWCCNWDECNQTCKSECPVIHSPSMKPIIRCTKFHYEWVTICNGNLIRYK
jgi:RHS repeat-associated protein